MMVLQRPLTSSSEQERVRRKFSGSGNVVLGASAHFKVGADVGVAVGMRELNCIESVGANVGVAVGGAVPRRLVRLC